MRRRKPPVIHRTTELVAADTARRTGDAEEAIRGYRAILAAHPEDAAVQLKLAALLAAEGDREGALAAFRVAADASKKGGYADRAVAVLKQAAEAFPDEVLLWYEAAGLQYQRGRTADAVATLLAGAELLFPTAHRPLAQKLLRRALELEPYQYRCSLLLAGCLARDRRQAEALAVLDGLAARLRGEQLHEVRRLAFRLVPSVRTAWRIWRTPRPAKAR